MNKICLLAALILMVFIICPKTEAQPITLFEDGFSGWSGWGYCSGSLPPAPDYYNGPPENIWLNPENPTYLNIQSQLSNYERKGFGYSSVFQLLDSSKLEVKFGVPADWGYKGIFETFLSLDSGYLGIGIKRISYGADFRRYLVAYSSYGNYEIPLPAFGGYNNFIIDIEDDNSKVGLYTLDDTEIWSYAFPYGTNTLGNNARINFGQYAGFPYDTTIYMAYVDNIKLTTEVIPEPSSFLLLGIGLIPFLRRKFLK